MLWRPQIAQLFPYHQWGGRRKMSPHEWNEPLVAIGQSAKQWQFHVVTLEFRNNMRSAIQHTTCRSNPCVSLQPKWGVECTLRVRMPAPHTGNTRYSHRYQRHSRRLGGTTVPYERVRIPWKPLWLTREASTRPVKALLFVVHHLCCRSSMKEYVAAWQDR